jgi:hypothetical protein
MENVSLTGDHVLVDPKRSQAGRAAAVLASASEPVPAGVQQLDANPARTAARTLLLREPIGCLVAEDALPRCGSEASNKEVRPAALIRLTSRPSPDR